MQRRKGQALFLALLILGIGLPGLVGIFVVQAQVTDGQPDLLINSVFQNGSTATPSPAFTSTSLPSQTPAGSPLSSSVLPLGISSLDIFAFIQAPNGHVERPYVVLTAFASISRSESVIIRGYIDSKEIICTETPCIVYLDGSARVIFRAFVSTGESSEEVISSVSVINDSQGYLVTIDSVSQFVSFVDSCALGWGVRDEENANWDSFVQFPYQINTQKTLHTLARNLILNGIVDTSACTSGGLSIGLDWPTTCGLETAASTMIEWQNQFDEYIWLAGREHGIPPKVLKTLIEVESQFWPGNSRFYLDEIGLGQINQLGIDVLLRQDPSLYQQICPTVLSDCVLPYISLETSQQALIRGAVVSSMDATCPTCENGFDLDTARDSISIISRLLNANCQKVDDILSIPYKPDADVDAATATAAVATVAAGGQKPGANYEDYWRFTLLAYHSGISCFQLSVNNTREAGLPVTWENLEQHLDCKGGSEYVNGVFDNLFAFDNYLYQAEDADRNLAEPTIVPTRTPVSTPTAFISSVVVKVQVYMDRNGNGVPDNDEWIDNMSVLLTTSDDDEISRRTENGVVIFDMTGYRPGLNITISLPGLYRSERFVLPETGEVPITFKFDQPVLPTILP
ncbi:MAG TPA: hypothetical protein VJ972_10045 [Anaerolineales bacterium]|nr:hypothetical protein [Anaerolineales bacterium]